jgi:hypothetical protein
MTRRAERALVRWWEGRQRARAAVVAAVAIAAGPPLDPHPDWVRDRLAADIGEMSGGDAAQ